MDQLVHPTLLQSIAFRLWQIYLPKIVKVDNYLLHLLAVQFICNGQWWLAESSEWWKSTKMWKKPPKSSKNEKLIFILHSTSDDQPSDPSNKNQLKCKKDPLSHQKMKCLVSDYVQLLMIGWAIWVANIDQNAK